MTRLGIIGYGRFGRAFADLATEAGLEVRAYDPDGQVPDLIRMESLATLADASTHIMLAVPVPALRPVVRDLRPLLRPGHVVLDVASVKLRAEATFAEELGADSRWVATHPLFGPSALALGQRPLRVVVCPNPLHPEATEDVRRMFSDVGCEVVMQDADTHDRVLARGHALTFFVAKGMLEVGGESLSADGPPSVRAMARVVDSVRSDAGHLFLAIERDNPYAARARAELIETLQKFHDQIDVAEPDDVSDARAMEIPDLGDRAPELRELRSLIDDVDRDLLRLLDRRARLARGAGRIKARHGHGIRDPGREMSVLADRRLWAEDHGLDPESVEEIFRAIMRLARSAQDAG